MQKFNKYCIVIIWLSVTLLVGCSKKSSPINGYIDADYTYISSNFSGILTELKVYRGDNVNVNQLLFKLEAQPQAAETKEAQAKVDTAQLQFKQKEIDLAYQANLYQHYQQLVSRGGISREDFNSVENKYNNAQQALKTENANLQSALAALEKAKWSISTKVGFAPVTGVVNDTYYTKGELVAAEQPILSLLAPENVKVVFFVKEPMLSAIKLKQQINIKCTNCTEAIPASISYISSKTEYTPPYIYSKNTQTKFIYLIEARFTPAAAKKIHPGQPVNVYL